ncbi:hypothetical protein HOR19_gp34 [Phage MedPE-SWcel-C56]|uniref:Uncharacterized protein n=1 Tax=Phage MedPE-SWcel-C56 TaxID=1871314 RepID=A0A1B1IY49_9CAUD|nr:hypothetical protein HOR19_gp34 [Phage MedPE-SWcel-C56]ANS06227.1 hypothetical protein [Phage MedPE-SWcel-C56]
MSNLVKLEGSINVSKATLIRLIGACQPNKISAHTTLVEFGMEEQKKKFAEILQKEFGIDLNLNTASELIKELRKC